MSDESPATKRHKRSASVAEPKKQRAEVNVPKKHQRTVSQGKPKQAGKHQRTVSTDARSHMHVRAVSTDARPHRHVRTASVEVKAKPVEQQNRPVRSRTRTTSVEVPLRARSSSSTRNVKKNPADVPVEPKAKVMKLTMPATPSFMK